MKTRKALPHLILTVLLVGVTALLSAASTGQIKGCLTDKETGDPIVGASVLVLGTVSGAMTDLNGCYVITQVKPGTYTLKISHMEYQAVEVTDVIVKSDLTFEVSQALTKGVTDLDVKITVKCEKDIIDKFEISNQTVIAADRVMCAPVTNVDQLLTQTPGVSHKKGDLRIRGGRAGEAVYMFNGVPAHGGTAIVNGEPFDAMFFENHGVNPFVDTEDDHFSTFAIDVDDASYVMARSYLEGGNMPHKDAVRTEEFVNRFDYNYDAPSSKAFDLHLEGSPSPFGQNCQMLRVGIKGLEVRAENRKTANLTFVVDISGSMAREDRLGLVKKALRMLVDELRPDDKVGLVVYGSNGRVILEPTSAEFRHEIIRAIESLHSGGSTNAEEGIRLGYKMADKYFEKGKINRVILCSDGVANVGRTSADDFLKEIKDRAERGVTLTTVGFGMGNFNDKMMEKLGDKGNGHYAYVSDLPEAKRIFVENLTGTLQVIARDVKIQVDFDPNTVRSYRLLGYENRDVEDAKFRDDKEDGGEIGSGHEVTALYEIKLHKDAEKGDLGTIYVRWKDPDNGDVSETNRKITRSVFRKSFDSCSESLKLAACAAEFAEMLRDSYWARGATYADLLKTTKGLVADSESTEVIELLDLIAKADRFDSERAEK